MRKFSSTEIRIIRKVGDILARHDCIYTFRVEEIVDPTRDLYKHTFCNILIPNREDIQEIVDIVKTAVQDIDDRYTAIIMDDTHNHSNPSITIQPINEG